MKPFNHLCLQFEKKFHSRWFHYKTSFYLFFFFFQIKVGGNFCWAALKLCLCVYGDWCERKKDWKQNATCWEWKWALFIPKVCSSSTVSPLLGLPCCHYATYQGASSFFFFTLGQQQLKRILKESSSSQWINKSFQWKGGDCWQLEIHIRSPSSLLLYSEATENQTSQNVICVLASSTQCLFGLLPTRPLPF